jgi:hypothetical protein
MLRRTCALLSCLLLSAVVAPSAWADAITINMLARSVGAGADIPGGPNQSTSDFDADLITTTASVSSDANEATGTAALSSSVSIDGRLVTGTGGALAHSESETMTANAHASTGLSMSFRVTAPQLFEFTGNFSSTGQQTNGGSPYQFGNWTAALQPSGSLLKSEALFHYDAYDTRAVHESGMLLPGTYDFGVSSLSVGDTSGGLAFGATSYGFRFSLSDAPVSQTPEPASAGLVAFGLLGVAYVTGRRPRISQIQTADPRDPR